eukprot:5610195-Amphidinium_carterae.1
MTNQEVKKNNIRFRASYEISCRQWPTLVAPSDQLFEFDSSSKHHPMVAPRYFEGLQYESVLVQSDPKVCISQLKYLDTMYFTSPTDPGA